KSQGKDQREKDYLIVAAQNLEGQGGGRTIAPTPCRWEEIHNVDPRIPGTPTAWRHLRKHTAAGMRCRDTTGRAAAAARTSPRERSTPGCLRYRDRHGPRRRGRVRSQGLTCTGLTRSEGTRCVSR